MPLSILAFTLALALVLAAVWVFLGGNEAQQQANLPRGDLIYADLGDVYDNTDLLIANDLGLIGKPDYLIRQADGNIIPVELKSGSLPDIVYEAHVMQLTAYCVLVEENYGIRPDYGILQYRDGSLEIDFTAELEEQLLQLLDEMHEDLFAQDVARSHDRPSLCAACRMRPFCDQRLV